MLVINALLLFPNTPSMTTDAAPAAQITATPRRPAPPTNTPRARTSTPTPLSTVLQGPLTGTLCQDCTRVRLRKTPGTAGEILGIIPTNVAFAISARSDDGRWLQITLPDGQTGWVSAQFVRQQDGTLFPAQTLNALAVNGVAIEASPTPTLEFLASVPNWLTGITSHARQIYLRGKSMGNRPNVFSRIGDSISSSPSFLNPFGDGRYNLGAYGSLSGVIAYFSQANARAGNSFINPSLAAGGGWTTEKLLEPGGAHREICGSLTPIACEYQNVRPALALIMIGTNDSGSGSPDVFANNLRQIVQITIDMGVIPVLSTIPPKNLGEDQNFRVDAYNNVIRQVAAQFDIPLWDYFSNMVGAPNRGMSADGLHPSESPYGSGVLTPESLQFGYTIRNLNALQVLDAIWRKVIY